MSPRPLRLRKISNPPPVSGFKPYGSKKNRSRAESIFLHYEEYEAIRLCDYEMLNHNQASVIMDVSRPTLTRIYARARQKIAQALVQGSQIIIEGGKIYFDSEWFSCKSCGCYFNNPEKEAKIEKCPLCHSTDIINFDENPENEEEISAHCHDVCVCTNCGHEQSHHYGKPCSEEICPKCGIRMVKKGTPHSKLTN
jgi:predicted DNA-binding protein (UPF0251 family)